MSVLEPYPTEEDIDMLKIFYSEKRIDCWVDWEAKKSMFYRAFPELEAAIKQQEISNKTLDAVVANLDYDPAWHDYLD